MAERVADAENPGLARALGPGMAIAIVVGNVIGAGIFLKPGEAATQAGSVWLAIAAWVAGGVLSLLGALTIAELALRLPQAGGLYVYLREAFGRPIGFLFGWSEFVIGVPASIGALAAGLAGMSGAIADRHFSVWEESAIAIGAILVLTAINVVGVAWGGRTQLATTAVKCLFLAALAALPFVLSALGYSGIDASNYRDTTEPAGGSEASLPVRFAGALLAVLWAYSGWHAVAPVAEEVKSPRRNIPIALLGGGVLLAALYLAIVLAYHGTLPMREIRDAGIRLPQAMTARLLSPFGSGVTGAVVIGISVAAFISIAGSLNANLMSGPRVGFAMARDGVFPHALSIVHARFRTPAAAIVTQATLSIVLVVSSATLVATVERFRARSVFELLTDCVTFIASIFLMLAVAAIFPIRWKRRGDSSPGYVTPFYPWVPLAYIAASALFVVYVFGGKPVEASTGVILTLAGLPFYWWMTHRTRQ
ncbi:MAG: amino acid permease [Planctomycetaceae bacterium]|nr:amino acid permease [Planctomycetaceae bacterium]